jgi:hypothetical protein
MVIEGTPDPPWRSIACTPSVPARQIPEGPRAAVALGPHHRIVSSDSSCASISRANTPPPLAFAGTGFPSSIT